MDLACRSGERLTGESDRWPRPGPCFFFSPCVCPLSVFISCPQPPPGPHPPAAPPRLPAGSESCPGAQAQRGRGIRAQGSLRAGEHRLGLPRPQPGPLLALSVPPSSALHPSCEPRVAHRPAPSQACLLCCLHSLTVSPSTAAGLVELPGWGASVGAVSLRQVMSLQEACAKTESLAQ